MEGLNESQRLAFIDEVRRLLQDFPYYSGKYLKIATKDASGNAGLAPLKLNRAQRYVHERLEEQLFEHNHIRAIVLKGRQQGISTYTEGRFYWKTQLLRGMKAYILTHLAEATDNLFAMVERYHVNMPDWLRPATDTNNARQLRFPLLDSGYKVGTAGSKGAGRSGTYHFFHGCLTPEVQVVDGQTDSLREMGSFAVGDWVRTHSGGRAQVSFISRQEKPVYRVAMRGVSGLPLEATGEHRFWTREGWKELCDIEPGEHIGFPVEQMHDDGVQWPFRLPDSPRPQGGGSREKVPDSVEPDYALGRVLGLYLAEGCIIKQHRTGVPSAVTFSVHEREVERTVEWLSAIKSLFVSARIGRRKNSKTVTVTAYGRSFATFVRNRCDELDGKRFPTDWRSCGAEFARGMVHGYLSGDGHSSNREYDRRIAAPSIRPAITIGIRDALASLGYGWAGISYRAGAIRNGRNERAKWTLRLCGSGVDALSGELGWSMPARRRNGNYGGAEIEGGFAWIKVNSIEAIGVKDVMDFEIDHPDHSYCTVHGATHNSEVAFWPNAEKHAAGVLQTVGRGNGSEVILESTANGPVGYFYSMWAQAVKGLGDFIAIFVPWYWQEEYQQEPPEGWKPEGDEAERMRVYGLTLAQTYWMHTKNIELGGQPGVICNNFMQEYPCTAAEAFVASGGDTVVEPALVAAARAREILDSIGARVMGVDPARMGADRTSMIDRKGRRAYNLLSLRKKKVTEVAAAVAKRINVAQQEGDPYQKVFVDVGGVGAGVVDILHDSGFEDLVVPVNFGGRPLDPELYVNKRAEMWKTMGEWFESEGGVDIPDSDSLHADLISPTYTHNLVRNQFVLESKEQMVKRGVPSPDEGDSLALTFAYPVAIPQTKKPRRPARDWRT